MIMDGCLHDGWDDPYAIKDVQRDVCVLSTRIDQHNAGGKGRNHGSVSDARAAMDYSRPDYSNGTGAMNVVSQLRTDCHLCSWYASHTKKANPHLEKICQNKKRHHDNINGLKDAKRISSRLPF